MSNDKKTKKKNVKNKDIKTKKPLKIKILKK